MTIDEMSFSELTELLIEFERRLSRVTLGRVYTTTKTGSVIFRDENNKPLPRGTLPSATRFTYRRLITGSSGGLFEFEICERFRPQTPVGTEKTLFRCNRFLFRVLDGSGFDADMKAAMPEDENVTINDLLHEIAERIDGKPSLQAALSMELELNQTILKARAEAVEKAKDQEFYSDDDGFGIF
jgi:hypothetical protein